MNTLKSLLLKALGLLKALALNPLKTLLGTYKKEAQAAEDASKDKN